MRPVVSIDDTIDFLNSLARKDNECIKKLCLHRELCNDSIVNDRYTNVHEEKNKFSLGMLGFLNGLFQNTQDFGSIIMIINENTGDVSFSKNDKI